MCVAFKLGTNSKKSTRKRGRSVTRLTPVAVLTRTSSAPSQSSPFPCAAVASSPASPLRSPSSPARKSVALDPSDPVLFGPLFPPFPPPDASSVSSPQSSSLLPFDPAAPWMVPFPSYLADCPTLLPAAPPSPRQPRLPPHHHRKKDGRRRERRRPTEHPT